MRTVSDNEYTPAAIKSELEQLYVATNYLNADSGELHLVVDLIGAAIQELDSVLPDNKSSQKLRLVHAAAQSERKA